MSESQPRHNDDRMRRATSWYKHSLHARSNDDKFMSLWVAFNAAYGLALLDPNVRNGSAQKEWDKLKDFLRKLVKEGTEQILDILWSPKLSDLQGDGLLHGPVPRLLNEQYVYCFFWYYVHNGVEHYAVEDDWYTEFCKTNKRCTEHLSKRKESVTSAEVRYVLEQVFSRLYTLRNQTFHGGTTYGPEGKGRGQLADATEVMKALVPAILKILQTHIASHPGTDLWGGVAYPHVDKEGRLIDEANATAG